MPPLANLRVVTIALNVPGPLAASHLRAAGAQVTKIEPPGGDPLETFCAPWYRDLHRDTTVERLDLKSAYGRARMHALLAGADLFLASQRPAALARLGLDAATLLAPRAPTAHLRWLNIVGECARPEVAGHDLTYLARAGLLGHEIPRTLVADVLGAERAFAMALLLMRQAAGAHAEVGLFDSLAPLIAPLAHGLTGPGALLGGQLPAYGIYDTRDGRIAVAALEPHFRARLYAELSLPDGSDLRAAFLHRSAVEWEAWAIARNLPLEAVREPDDV
jgi:alpha-methylacyl-CoA racemase